MGWRRCGRTGGRRDEGAGGVNGGPGMDWQAWTALGIVAFSAGWMGWRAWRRGGVCGGGCCGRKGWKRDAGARGNVRGEEDSGNE